MESTQPQLICGPDLFIADATHLLADHGLNHALGVPVDGRAAIATLLDAPRHRALGATEHGSGIANPRFNR
jgi:hypothetical protein